MKRILLVAAAALSACYAAPSSTTAVSSSVVGPAGGQLRSSDGLLVIDVPAGALAKDETLTVTVAASSPVPSNVDPVGAPYAFGPASVTFAKPLSVHLAPPAWQAPANALLLFAAGAEATPLNVTSVADPSGAISAALPGPATLQLGHALLLNGTTIGGTTGSGTTGSGTTTGSVTFCGGSAGATGSPGYPEKCQYAAAPCQGGMYEVDCTQGDCTCLVNGAPTASFQLPTDDCNGAWSQCGFPPNTVRGMSLGTTTGGSPGGSATVTGFFPLQGSANSYVVNSSAGSSSSVVVSLAETAACGGFDASGRWIDIGLVGALPPTGGYFAVAPGGQPPPAQNAFLSLNEWDPAAGVATVVAMSVDGGVVVTGYDGGLSGSFDVNVALGDGGLEPLSGTFTGLPACGP